MSKNLENFNIELWERGRRVRELKTTKFVLKYRSDPRCLARIVVRRASCIVVCLRGRCGCRRINMAQEDVCIPNVSRNASRQNLAKFTMNSISLVLFLSMKIDVHEKKCEG